MAIGYSTPLTRVYPHIHTVRVRTYLLHGESAFNLSRPQIYETVLSFSTGVQLQGNIGTTPLCYGSER